MKNMYRLCFIVLLLIWSVYFPACTSSTDSSSKKVTVSFQDVWLSDEVDNDQDDYVSYVRLNFDLDVSKGSKEVFVKIGVRVTDPMDTSTFYLYMQSIPFTISGTTTEDAVYIAIGYPNDELPEGIFDFLIQVCDQANPEDILAELAPANDDDFYDVLTAV